VYAIFFEGETIQAVKSRPDRKAFGSATESRNEYRTDTRNVIEPLALDPRGLTAPSLTPLQQADVFCSLIAEHLGTDVESLTSENALHERSRSRPSRLR
jgi:hypothetical protein